MTATDKFTKSLSALARRFSNALFSITHNGFALLGLAVIFSAVTLTLRPEIRQAAGFQIKSWIDGQQEAQSGLPVDEQAIERTTAVDPQDLPKQQAKLAFWLSKKYNIAPEPLGALIAEAYESGIRTNLDPTLILAVMAIESGFNPFAQSAVGAQGLMQVMTTVHKDKYENFGGKLAAFDPVSNLRVGAKVLGDCIARAGSIEGGLKLYVGAGNLGDDGGYSAKVLAEHARLKQVVQGRPVSMFSPVLPAGINSKTPPDGQRVASALNY